jgi:predicted Zn-dependent peptidase
LVFDELWKLISTKEAVDEEELWKAKMHIRGQHLISGENANTRMNRLASQELYFARYIPDEDILAQIDEIQPQQLKHLTDEVLQDAFGRTAVAVVGPEAPGHYQLSSIQRLFDDNQYSRKVGR